MYRNVCCMYVNVLHVWRVPEEGTESSGTRVAEGSEPQDRCWELGEASALNRCWGVFQKSGLFFSFWVILFNASGVGVFFLLLSPGLSIFSGVLIPALCQYRWLVLNFISDWFEAWDDTCWNPCAFTNINNRYLTDLQCRGTAHPCFIPHPTALLWSWAEVLQPLPPSLAMTSSCLPLMSFSFGEPQHLNWIYNPIRAVIIWFHIFKALVIIAHLFLPGLTLFRRIVLFCF